VPCGATRKGSLVPQPPPAIPTIFPHTHTPSPQTHRQTEAHKLVRKLQAASHSFAETKATSAPQAVHTLFHAAKPSTQALPKQHVVDSRLIFLTTKRQSCWHCGCFAHSLDLHATQFERSTQETNSSSIVAVLKRTRLLLAAHPTLDSEQHLQEMRKGVVSHKRVSLTFSHCVT
jgi:hypothetical protein